MARADRRRSQRTRPAAVTRRSEVVIEDTMFFPRLRRHAKWVFLFLAVAFGLGFVGFGVGAGGVGVGELFKGSSGASGVPSVSDAQERVNENPKDAKAFRDLANALSGRGRDRAGDRGARGLHRIAAEERRRASPARLPLPQPGPDRAGGLPARASSGASYLAPRGAVLQGITLDGKPLELDSFSNAVGSVFAQESNAALGTYQEASSQLVATYRRLAVATPDDPSVQLQLADAAQDIGDVATAIAAYETYLRTPGISEIDKRQIRRIIKQLQAQTAG